MVDKRKIIYSLEKDKQRIKELGVTKIGIFGSFIKSKQKRNSDIDILVKFDNKDYGDQYFQLLFYLKDLFKRKIDLIPEDCLRKELNYVKKEAIYVRI